MNMINIKQVQT